MAAVPTDNQQKLTAELTGKIEEHDRFKQNLQILSNKSIQQPSNSSGVYSVLSASNSHSQDSQRSSYPDHDQQNIYHPPSMFGGGRRHQNENVPTGSLRIDENAHGSSINYTSLHAANHNSSNSNLQGTYNSASNRNAPPPQIFSASINGANLMQNPDHNQISDNQSQRKPHEHNIHPGSQNYSHGLGLGSSIHIGMSSNAPTSQQQPYSQANSSNMQYSQQGSYVQESNYSQSSSSGLQYVQTTTAYQGSGNEHIQTIDGPHNTSNQQQQPTYVLLQAPDSNENGGPPQVFLAMQTPGITNQDSQQSPYITLQPVNVEQNDLPSNTMVQGGMNLQSAVLGSNNEIPREDKQSITGDGGQQQVVLSLPTQQNLNANQSLVTYLQPLGSLGVPNMEQGQVIIGASDMQGNLTLHNVAGLTAAGKRVVTQSRQSSQIGLTTPRRRLSTDPRCCDQCGRTFKYPSDLKKHLQIHTDIKKFACDDCPRTFRRLHQLNVHRRIHTGEKPYVCNRCGAQFRHDSTLTMHIRTRHDHLKPFSCDGCSKKFGRMSHLRKHQRNVCGRSNSKANFTVVQCKHCDVAFTKKSELKAHLLDCEKRPDSNNKELLTTVVYVCDQCGKSFNRIYDYKRHQLTHSEEKPYGCPQCGKSFRERASLNKHVKRMHCSEGDGTIPIDDDGIIAGDDDDDDEDDLSEEEGALSIVGNVSGHTTTATVTAQALAEAGIITSADGQMMTVSGQTISATEILNFPEVAEALGINSGAHATIIDTDGSSTMIAITQPGDLETSEVTMDMDHGDVIDENSTPQEEDPSQYITTTESLQMSPVIQQVDDDPTVTTETSSIYVIEEENSVMPEESENDFISTSKTSLDSSMVFKQDPDTQFIKHEDDRISDHVKAEQAAAHDLQTEDQPEDSITIENTIPEAEDQNKTDNLNMQLLESFSADDNPPTSA